MNVSKVNPAWIPILSLSGLLLVLTAAWVSGAGAQEAEAGGRESESTATFAVDAADDEDGDKVKEPPYEPKSKAELKRMLTPIQFKVTQSEGTEPAFRNQYWDNKDKGVYRCVVCGLSLFSSETKFKSGTGWPSFYQPIKPDHVGYKTDWHLFYPRKEVHCSRCSAHLGHVFDDGPRDKTGKRYCMNSAALRFEEAEKK